MPKKIYILLLFITFGFFMMPSTGYACNNSIKETSCKKVVTSRKAHTDCSKEDCCNKNNNSKNNQHGCSGKCSHSNCTTSGLQFSLIAINEIEFNNNVFNFSVEKSISQYKESSISDGFTTIWSPPKIK